MNAEPASAHFEFSIDGKPRTYRDTKTMANQAAAVLRRAHPNSDVVAKDLREGTTRLMIAAAEATRLIQSPRRRSRAASAARRCPTHWRFSS
jgi:hypothetical protein